LTSNNIAKKHRITNQINVRLSKLIQISLFLLCGGPL